MWCGFSIDSVFACVCGVLTLSSSSVILPKYVFALCLPSACLFSLLSLFPSFFWAPGSRVAVLCPFNADTCLEEYYYYVPF